VSGTLTITTPEGAAVEGGTVTLTAGIVNTSTKTLASGQYLVQVRLAKGGKYAGLTEALHIYPGLTSELPEKTYTDADFTEPPGRPGGLKLIPGIKELNASWTAVSGAASYEVWYAVGTAATLNDAQKFSTEPTTNSVTITGLADSTVYKVWIKAKNSGGLSRESPPVASRKTSDPVNPFWYTGDFDYWDSETDGYEITATTLDYNTMPPWGNSELIGGFGYKGDIRYYVEFDLEEAALIEPKTQRGKWGESLAGYPSGVFIIEYREGYAPANRPGNFFGVYFYGLGAVQEPDPSGYPYDGHSLAVNHQGDRLAYLGNSFGLNEAQGGPDGGPVIGDPETATLEEAIERFTLENMKYFIAYVATPWYRLKGTYTTGAENDWVREGPILDIHDDKTNP
jgi:hypothetical protein